MRAFAVALMTALLLPRVTSSAAETFTGVITDGECDDASHARMRMGPTDAECVKACIEAHGASYVLYDGTRVYALDDQRASQPFAGRKVIITGTLDGDGRMIRVESLKVRE